MNRWPFNFSESNHQTIKPSNHQPGNSSLALVDHVQIGLTCAGNDTKLSWDS